jgi:hypothetical protein
MGIARARVVEVASTHGTVGSGYLLGDRLVLTGSRSGPATVRPAGTATWLPCSSLWAGGGVAVLGIDDPSALMLPPDRVRWGRVTGRRPLAVTAMGFPPAATLPTWPRDAQQFLGHVVADGDGRPLKVTATTGGGEGMRGAALFAGAELVGVLDGPHAVPIAPLAEDDGFVDLFGHAGVLTVTPVSTPLSGFPILPA